MRKFALSILLFLAIAPLHAQELHKATDLHEFLMRAKAGIVHDAISPVTVDAQPAPFASKTFNITAIAGSANNASSFRFDVTPTPFAVNAGDSVTINITVPSNDQSTGGIGHGFFLESYFENFSFLISRGQTRSINFVANQPGTFSYICTQSSCGVGHTVMGGTFTVNAVQAPAPTIASLNPATGPTSGGNVVTISGANFTANASVKFDNTNAIGVTVNGSTSITATAPAHAAGPVTVTVTNSDGQSGTASYTYADPTISITAVSPNTGTTAGGTSVTISGAAFQPGATVTFGALPATNVTVVNATTITATTPLGPATEQLKVDVTVKNPDGKSATQQQAFTYTVPPLSIDAVSPSSVITTGGQQITITGKGFTTALASSVTIDGVAATGVNVVDAVTMTAIVPPHASGAADVAVKVGNTTATKSGGLTYFVFTAPPKRRAAKH